MRAPLPLCILLLMTSTTGAWAGLAKPPAAIAHALGHSVHSGTPSTAQPAQTDTNSTPTSSPIQAVTSSGGDVDTIDLTQVHVLQAPASSPPRWRTLLWLLLALIGLVTMIVGTVRARTPSSR